MTIEEKTLLCAALRLGISAAVDIASGVENLQPFLSGIAYTNLKHASQHFDSAKAHLQLAIAAIQEMP